MTLVFTVALTMLAGFGVPPQDAFESGAPRTDGSFRCAHGYPVGVICWVCHCSSARVATQTSMSLHTVRAVSDATVVFQLADDAALGSFGRGRRTQQRSTVDLGVVGSSSIDSGVSEPASIVVGGTVVPSVKEGVRKPAWTDVSSPIGVTRTSIEIASDPGKAADVVVKRRAPVEKRSTETVIFTPVERRSGVVSGSAVKQPPQAPAVHEKPVRGVADTISRTVGKDGGSNASSRPKQGEKPRK